MAKGYSLQALGVLDGTVPPTINDGAVTNSVARKSTAIITGASLVAQGVGAINDTIVVGQFPVNSLFGSIEFQSDTTLTGVTLNVGTAANPTKYGSLAAPTANTLYKLQPVAARIAGQYTANEQIVLTVTAAALPGTFNAELALNYQSIV